MHQLYLFRQLKMNYVQTTFKLFPPNSCFPTAKANCLHHSQRNSNKHLSPPRARARIYKHRALSGVKFRARAIIEYIKQRTNFRLAVKSRVLNYLQCRARRQSIQTSCASKFTRAYVRFPYTRGLFSRASVCMRCVVLCARVVAKYDNNSRAEFVNAYI